MYDGYVSSWSTTQHARPRSARAFGRSGGTRGHTDDHAYNLLRSAGGFCGYHHAGLAAFHAVSFPPAGHRSSHVQLVQMPNRDSFVPAMPVWPPNPKNLVGFDARYRGPGFIPLASIILLASGERRKSRKAFAVSASFRHYLLNFPPRCWRSRLFSQGASMMSLSGIRCTCSFTCHGLV
jgi:hypothetical protein